MIRIFAAISVAAAANDFYIPAPCRGVVKAFSVVHSEETDADELFTLFHGTNAVSVCTPTDALAEGTLIKGVMDSTYEDSVYDPDSDTVADQVFHIDNLDTLDTAGVLGVYILFDDSAAITQDALEA